jgi:glycosyltransferase involved in cell wall biosynthesis
MKGALKILQLGKFFPPHFGGIETFTYNLVTSLNNDGVTCDVLCSNQKFELEESSDAGFNVTRTKSFGILLSVSLSPQIISKLRQLWANYDIVHVHHPDPLGALALWLVKPKCRIVVTWHSDIVRQKWLALFFAPLQNWLLKRADAIVATSSVYITGSEGLQKYPEKTSVIPLGVDPIPRVGTEDIQALRSSFPGKKYFVFSLGRLVPYKGYKNLIKAACSLTDDFQILIGGGGRLYPSLSKQIETLGVGSKVRLLGKVPDEKLALYYNMCDVFCLPSVSRNEAFGLVLPEAMSVGKPVIATNIPASGVSWVNQHGVSGLNVEVNDPEGLARAITLVCNDEQMKQKFSEGSQNRFEQCFTTAKMAQNYLELYQSLF